MKQALDRYYSNKKQLPYKDFKRIFNGYAILGGIKANITACITKAIANHRKYTCDICELWYTASGKCVVKTIELARGDFKRAAKNIYEDVYSAIPARVPDKITVRFPYRRYAALVIERPPKKRSAIKV